MFKKERILKLFFGIIITLVLGAIIVPLLLDPNMGIIKEKKENNITDNVETIEEDNNDGGKKWQ